MESVPEEGPSQNVTGGGPASDESLPLPTAAAINDLEKLPLSESIAEVPGYGTRAERRAKGGIGWNLHKAVYMGGDKADKKEQYSPEEAREALKQAERYLSQNELLLKDVRALDVRSPKFLATLEEIQKNSENLETSLYRLPPYLKDTGSKMGKYVVAAVTLSGALLAFFGRAQDFSSMFNMVAETVSAGILFSLGGLIGIQPFTNPGMSKESEEMGKAVIKYAIELEELETHTRTLHDELLSEVYGAETVMLKTATGENAPGFVVPEESQVKLKEEMYADFLKGGNPAEIAEAKAYFLDHQRS